MTSTSIGELLTRGKTFSFEFMPPRTPEREQQLEQTLQELEPLKPSFVSITYGAGGSTRQRTHDLVCKLLHDSSMLPMAHLTCAAHSKADLHEILERYAHEGLRNVLALQGDPPLNATKELERGELHLAIDLVNLAREISDYCVAVAVHPEGHPKAPDVESDRKFQAAKLSAADFGITQFFFRASDYFRLVDEMAKLGIEKPIIPGVMPPVNLSQLTKMAQLSGASIPPEVLQRLELAGDDRNLARRIGVDIATELCAELLEGDVPGLHFYTMNRSGATREIYSNLGL